MPKLSFKATNMPASPIRKLVPFAEAAKSQGKNVIHLNIGQPDIETPESAKNAIKNTQIEVLEYSHSAGFESYRSGLSNYYAKNDVKVSKDEIIVTTGGSEALLFGFSVALNPGDEVIIPEPFYANYNGFANTTGINIVPVTSKIEDGFALPAIEEFEKKITDKTKAILICNPANPTGYLYTQEELEKLSELIKEKDLFLFADEVYREFCYDGAKPFSVMNLQGVDENVILIDSVSKRYSMCGARIGALISRNKEFMDSAMKFAQARLSPPTYAQIAAEGALDTPQSYFDDVTNEYVARRDIMVDGLNKIKGVNCPKPKGAFYAVAEFPVEDTEHFCQWLLEDFEYEGNTVMMAPLSGFYATKGLGKKEVRIAYVLEKSQLENALTCIEKALKKYPNTTY
ncbi:pyridoxal phosphate-dependent aminotransferase [Brumimicrobium aurantiacum]|uniref:Aminotransferase n=1 Tax=Brumimicrobium aurantiacum TaxID=1737063 RepID=A0A3E1EYP9_9FLAO|nr:pyridoxal phosphate-dependent aminotransferase [Brumimicrobium aurantiacum]RFC54668.1 pyridoxal phosphate-dependent aminotransferase [Brumimicrobium aurantiacum]